MDVVLVRLDRAEPALTAHVAAVEAATGRRTVIAAAVELGEQALVLSGGVPALHAVLTSLVRRDLAATTAIGWVPDPDVDSLALAAALGLPAAIGPAVAAAQGEARALRLVRDDHGGVLLHRGTITAATGTVLGAQSYHDDRRIADGPVRQIVVEPRHGPATDLQAVVSTPRRLRPARESASTGRAVQTACDEAVVTADGVTHPRPVTRWTWYADPRQQWLIRGARR